MPLFPNLAIMLTGHNNNGFQKFESGSWSIFCSSDKQKNFCLSELQKILNNHIQRTHSEKTISGSVHIIYFEIF